MVTFTKEKNVVLKTDAKSIISTKKLGIGYTKESVIANAIDLNISSAQLIAIIGINGSGKTTLLKTLSGLQKPLHGEYFLNEKKFASFSNQDLASKLSLVLTNQNFSKNLSVKEFISLGRHPYTNWLGMASRADQKQISNAIQEVGIEQLKHKNCDELSDGQLQKVMIARALTQDTPLIFMDEPTSHLDMYHKAQVLHLLKNITKKTQKTIVFATHEINLALQLCDEIILINNGKVIQGKPKLLIQQKMLLDLFPKDLIYFDEKSESFRMNIS